MSTRDRIRRSRFLQLSAAGALTVAAAACSRLDLSTPPPPGSVPSAVALTPVSTRSPIAGSPTPEPSPVALTTPVVTPPPVQTPFGTPTPSPFREAPMLADLVRATGLPTVDKRLPTHPYVVPHAWATTGRYGGQLRLASANGSDPSAGQVGADLLSGASPLRWLKDGLEIGPGLVERWETSADGTLWTLHFREGLKWSDGKPWTTGDILFWWQDEVLNADLKEPLPAELTSQRGTPAIFHKIDDVTLRIQFDTAAPLMADWLASATRRGGPRWMDPKHYLTQFHPTYRPLAKGVAWVDRFRMMRDAATNPDCPTMNGWALKTYLPGQQSVWLRNPYYWAVDRDGNQLPYLDKITIAKVADADGLKLQISNDKVDYLHGASAPITLADVASLEVAGAKSGMELRLWDGGSGSGTLYALNYDHADPKVRALFRDPKFRKALSHALDRAAIQDQVYFGAGEPTTGTTSPKAIEFRSEANGAIYHQWRDLAVTHDSVLARQLLDGIGAIDRNGDGWRELPDGTPLEITVDYPSDLSPTSDAARTNLLAIGDWRSVGLNVRTNPVAPASYDALWSSGKLMLKAVDNPGASPNGLIDPRWLVPIDATGWAPLQGAFHSLIGTPKEKAETNVDPYKRQPPRVAPEPNGAVDRLWQVYERSRTEMDPAKRVALVREMIQIHLAEGPFFIGTVANIPRIVLARKGLQNVPKRGDLAQHGFVDSRYLPSPAVYDPETYFWDAPDAHV